MPTFAQIATKIRNINILLIFQQIMRDADLTNIIIDLITKRLYKEGTTGDGIELETDKAGRLYPYSNYTVVLKDESGQPYDRVTLNQTGQFYKSLSVKIDNDGFTIDAEFRKSDGHMFKNFQNRFSTSDIFEKSVLSLSKQEFEVILKQYFVEQFPKILDERIKMS
jgi:hypothetical protein